MYVGSTLIKEAYKGSSCVYVDYNPLGLPAYTIRAKFTSGYTPTQGDTQTLVDATENVWDITKSNSSWDSLFENCTDLLDVLGANTKGVAHMVAMFGGCSGLLHTALFDTSAAEIGVSGGASGTGMFEGCTALTAVPSFNFSSARYLSCAFKDCTALQTVKRFATGSALQTISMFQGCTSLVTAPELNISSVAYTTSMFRGCSALTTVPLYDTSSVEGSGSMFTNCSSLETVPLFDLSAVQTTRGGAGGMFQGCSSLKEVPLFNMPLVTNVGNMFNNCTSVESGALALYQRLSTQTNPPSTKTGCFTNCGSGTVTGAAELAQIPSSWGGTGA